MGTEPQGRSLPPLGHPVHDGWWRGLYLNFEKWLENDLFEMNGRKRNLAPSSSRGPDLAAAVAGGPPGLAAAVVGAPVGVSAASAAAAGAPAGPASSPPASLHANGFPAWWTSSSPVSFRHESSPSAGLYPPGGFTNFMQSNNTLEDFHLVGNTTSRTSVGPSATSYRGTPPGESNAQDKETITVDADETIEDSRTEKRLNWTKDEDIRLASAWVHNSKDPVDGTDRKSDQYWADVTEEYNKTTEVCRRRNRNQLKICWDRVKKPVSEFHGC